MMNFPLVLFGMVDAILLSFAVKASVRFYGSPGSPLPRTLLMTVALVAVLAGSLALRFLVPQPWARTAAVVVAGLPAVPVLAVLLFTLVAALTSGGRWN